MKGPLSVIVALIASWVIIGGASAALISKDCSEIGSAAFFTCDSSSGCPSVTSANAAYGEYTCSPKQCTMVSNSAAATPSPSPAECPFSTGSCSGTTSYGFTKDNVFKNLAKKTCDADLSAAAYSSVCSKAALAKNFMLAASSGDDATKAHLESGIRLVYCNDQYLVIHTVNVPNHPVGLLANPHPPGSGFTSAGVATTGYDDQTVTRYNMVQYSVYKIPLVPRDLGTSAVANNNDRFTETFAATLASAAVSDASELTFGAASSGNIHAGYVITGTGLKDKTVVKQCDSAEIVGGTGGVSSTTLTVAWTVIGTVCKGSKVASTCSDGSSGGKYVVISSTRVQLSSCSIVGGVGTCTMATAQSVASGTTLQVKNADSVNVVCSLTEKTSAAIDTSVSIAGTHNSVYDLPSYTGSKYYPGIPIYGPLAVAVTGQVLYPIFDDQGYTSQEMCEIDMCNGHAGKGFDYHYHGDPYHHTPGKCLYSPKDFADTVSGHPPIIAYSLDGYKVYGRHLATTNVGYSTTLDDCGGHSHGDFGYHYHAQVQQLTAVDGSTLYKKETAASYYAPIPGVYKCWRGDIGAQRIFGSQVKFDDRADFEDIKPCTGTNQYWAHSSLKDISGGVGTDLSAAFTNIKGTSAWPTASLAFTFTSTYTADQIAGSTTLTAAIKTGLASALGLQASDITSITATAARRQAERHAAGMEFKAASSSVDRNLGLGTSLGLGAGLDVDRLDVGQAAAREKEHTSRLTTQSVKITATISSAYTASTLAAAYSTYSSVFTSSFSASTGGWISDPSAAPSSAPEALSSTNKTIIGVVVGVGGLIVLAGLGFACYACSVSTQAKSAGKMPVESSHQAHVHAHQGPHHGDEGGIEVAMALTHADDGAGQLHGTGQHKL